MLRSFRTRWRLLGGALLAATVASVWPNGPERGVPETVANVTPRSAALPEEKTLPAPPKLLPPAALRERQRTPPEVNDLFGAKSWNPPSRAQGRPTAPPAPMAPPFPYTIVGNVVDANGVMVIFTNQNQNYVLRAGELLDQTYRVEAIDAQSVTLTYLPLGLTQRVPTGAP